MTNGTRRTMNALYVLLALGLLLGLSLGIAVLAPTTPAVHGLPTKVPVLSAPNANLTTDASWQSNVAACGSGAVVGAVGGAVIGSIGAGVGAAPGAAIGAGVGCIAGLAGFHLGSLFNGQTAGDAAIAAENQFQLDMAANLNNYGLGLSGMVNLTQSQLLTTFNAWSAMTDAVAPAELPNATFDPLFVLNESGVAIQMDTLANDYVNLAGSSINSINGAEAAGYGPGGTFTSGIYGLSFQTAVWGRISSAAYYGTAGADMAVQLYNGDGLIVRSGGVAEFECVGGPSAFIASSPSVINGSTSTVHLGTTTVHPFILKTAAATLWVLGSAGSGGCSVEGSGILGVPVSVAHTPGDNVTWVSCGADTSTGCDAANYSTRSTTQGFAQLPIGGCAFGAISHACIGPTYAAPPVNAFASNFNSLFINAATSAKAYWLFLHLLGYNSSSQVPSNCLIPTPSQVLPPSYAVGVGTLSLNETLSLYSAWMNGLATFFNTPYNATNFCHGHQPFVLGFALWNQNTRILGFVYTLPVAHQVFGTLSTWTVTNASTGPNRTANGSARGLRTAPTPIVLWPTVLSLNLPIGRVQEVPVNDPILGFVPANGTLYSLSGNGTAVTSTGFTNGTVSSVTGAAIYVSSCAVLNPTTGAYVPQVNYCKAVLSTINNVSFNFSSSTVPPVPTGGCAGAATFLLGPFVSFWATVTGATSLGCGLAEFAAIVTVVIIVVVIVYVIAAVVRRT